MRCLIIMVMKNKILAKLPNQNFLTCSSEVKYIMDYTNQTKNIKRLEWSAIKPTDIDAFTIKKEVALDITFCPFKENTIKIEGISTEHTHCEGMLFPTTNNDDTWLLLLELKYPKFKNLGEHLKEAKDQLFKTLDLFRQQGIIKHNKLVYLISSAPKYTIRIPFNNFSMTSEELKLIRKEKKAIVKCTNEIIILNENKLKV